MIAKIENFIFSERLLPIKKFVQKFCKSPVTNSAQLIYITGGISTGKTTLLNTIGTELLLNHPELKINRIETDALVSHLLRVVSENKGDEFLNHYLKSEIVLIDNYELLNEKHKTTEVIINLLRSLIMRNVKIILSSSDTVGFKAISKVVGNTNLKLIDLDENTINIDRLVKMKSKLFGLKTRIIRPETNDIREIEGIIKKEKFLQTLALMN